jgi:hypothetical protein
MMARTTYDQSVAIRQLFTIRARQRRPKTPEILRPDFGQKYDQKKIGNRLAVSAAERMARKETIPRYGERREILSLDIRL